MGGCFLVEVNIRTGEGFDSCLRRFNKLVLQSGVLKEARRRGHFEAPSARRKRKAAEKMRKSRKNSQRDALRSYD